jgi:endoglucanase
VGKKHNVYLILNIHVPQGGFQSNGEGMELWDNPENQKRLKHFGTTLLNAIEKSLALLGTT